MYQVQNYDTGKRLKSFDTYAEAREDAQRRANRYNKPYSIMWLESSKGPTLRIVYPERAQEVIGYKFRY